MGISKFSLEKRRKDSYVISEENALEIVLKACDEFDIDVDSEIDKKQKKKTEALLNSILDFVKRGVIEINTSTWEITQHLQRDYGSVKEITYKPITGKEKMAMDGKDENDRYEMMYAVLGEASGVGAPVIQKLLGADSKAAESLTIFFL